MFCWKFGTFMLLRIKKAFLSSINATSDSPQRPQSKAAEALQQDESEMKVESHS